MASSPDTTRWPRLNWRQRVFRRRSQWEQDRLRLFWQYLGDDFDEPPRMRLLSRALVRLRSRAFFPAQHIHCPHFGLRKRAKPTPMFRRLLDLRKA